MTMKFQDSAGITMSSVSAVLSLGTTSTYTTTVTTEAIINGKWGTTLGAQTNTATPTTDANTGVAFPPVPINNAVAIVFGITLAGAIAMVQGPITPTAVGVTSTAGAFINPPQFPPLPDNFCPLGYTLVRVAPSAAPFVAGTSSWTASGITSLAVVNIAALPDRPQVA